MSPPPLNSLFTHLLVLTDPRREGSVEHSLSSFLFIAVCAVIGGAANWMEGARRGTAKQKWLSTLIDLPNGNPSHDTFRQHQAQTQHGRLG